MEGLENITVSANISVRPDGNYNIHSYDDMNKSDVWLGGYVFLGIVAVSLLCTYISYRDRRIFPKVKVGT